MALQASGQPISAKDIRNEFGPFPTVSFGAYRLQNQTLNTNSDTVSYKEVLGIEEIPLDAGIPTSGEIKFSDFYGKSLNLIVDFYNHPTESIPITSLTKDINFTVFRQGDATTMISTFTPQDGSGDTFTVTNKSSNGEKTEIKTVKKNVTYNVVFSRPDKVQQNGLIASSDGLKSTASDTGTHSKGGKIQKLVAGTSKKAFGDTVGSNNDRDDMQITVKDGIFTSGAGTRINTSGTSVAGAIDGFTGTENQRTTRLLTYTYTESISTTKVLLRKNIKTRYGENSPNTTIVVGGFKSKPTSDNVTGKVIAFVNQDIGSAKGNINNVAFKTGTWGTNTIIEIVVGASGRILGAGGNGGNGGSFGANPNRYNPGNGQSQTAFDIGNISATNGTDGSSALGIEYPTKVINGGVIRAGRGGGGGGGSGSGVDFHDTSDCSSQRTSPLIGGGGGAGGSGLPVGNGGQLGNYLSRLSNKQGGSTTMPTGGTSASATVDGQGGSGGSATPQDQGKCARKIATSGAGGAAESNGGDGDNVYTSKGLGGQRGYGIIISSSGSLVGGSISGNASDGNTLNPGTIT